MAVTKKRQTSGPLVATSEAPLDVLTLNAGSSSLKFALYSVGETERRVAVGNLDRIGLADGRFRGQSDGATIDRVDRFRDHGDALERLFAWLQQLSGAGSIDAIGHRIVQGGATLTQPQRLTPESLAELKSLIPLAPNHLPGEIEAIEGASRMFPRLPQVGCFDTAFHRAMPAVTQRWALPREYFDRGVQRYGFHGLSYQYIVEELHRISPEEAEGRLVIAHLGNGASMAAVRAGAAVDTTMGLTPLGGLVMGTRTGDLDPGVVLHFMRQPGMTVDKLEDLLSKRSGLLGISATSSDMKDLLDREGDDPRAAEAIEIFCRQARKFVAAMAAALGGIDALIFTGGIGEHAAPIRDRIAGGLGFLGATIDPARNAAGEEVISVERSPVVVRVMKTNEELMIARQTAGVLRGAGFPACQNPQGQNP